jgi:hypothetical protein
MESSDFYKVKYLLDKLLVKLAFPSNMEEFQPKFLSPEPIVPLESPAPYEEYPNPYHKRLQGLFASPVNIYSVEFQPVRGNEFMQFLYDNMPSNFEDIERMLAPFITSAKTRQSYARVISSFKEISPVFDKLDERRRINWNMLLFDLVGSIGERRLAQALSDRRNFLVALKEFDTARRSGYYLLPQNHLFLRQFRDYVSSQPQIGENEVGKVKVESIKTEGIGLFTFSTYVPTLDEESWVPTGKVQGFSFAGVGNINEDRFKQVIRKLHSVYTGNNEIVFSTNIVIEGLGTFPIQITGKELYDKFVQSKKPIDTTGAVAAIAIEKIEKNYGKRITNRGATLIEILNQISLEHNLDPIRHTADANVFDPAFQITDIYIKISGKDANRIPEIFRQAAVLTNNLINSPLGKDAERYATFVRDTYLQRSLSNQPISEISESEKPQSTEPIPVEHARASERRSLTPTLTILETLAPKSANVGGVELQPVHRGAFKRFVYDNLPSDFESIKQALRQFITDEAVLNDFAARIKSLKDSSPTYDGLRASYAKVPPENKIRVRHEMSSSNEKDIWTNILMELSNYAVLKELRNRENWFEAIQELNRIRRSVAGTEYYYFPQNNPFVQQYKNFLLDVQNKLSADPKKQFKITFVRPKSLADDFLFRGTTVLYDEQYKGFLGNYYVENNRLRPIDFISKILFDMATEGEYRSLPLREKIKLSVDTFSVPLIIGSNIDKSEISYQIMPGFSLKEEGDLISTHRTIVYDVKDTHPLFMVGDRKAKILGRKIHIFNINFSTKIEGDRLIITNPVVGDQMFTLAGSWLLPENGLTDKKVQAEFELKMLQHIGELAYDTERQARMRETLEKQIDSLAKFISHSHQRHFIIDEASKTQALDTAMNKLIAKANAINIATERLIGRRLRGRR